VIRDALLGLRLAGAGGRGGVVRLALMASGSAAAAFLVLTSVGLAGVADRQEVREQRITPRIDHAVGGTVQANAVLLGDGWDGRELRRVVLAADVGSTPLPPGVARLPEAGEVLLSPALARLTETEALISERFPQRHGPRIEPAGLVAPDQLLAYVGTTADQLGPLAVRILGFGDPDADGRIDPRAARTIGMLVTLLLIAPVVMFMTVCARLSANARSQRLAALRLVGLSTARTQIVNAAEAGTAAVTGSLLGLGLWLGWRAVRPTARIGVFGWYSNDLHIPAARLVVILVTLAVIAIVSGALAATPGVTHALRTRRERSTRHLSPLRIVPLVAGVVVLAVSRATATPGGSTASFESWTAMFGTGLVLTIVGLVTTTPYAAVVIGTILARSPRPALLLAGNRLRHEPAASSRVVAALAVALFAAGIGQVVATALDHGDEEIRSALPPVVNFEVIGPETTPARYEALSPLHQALPAVRVGPEGQELDAVVATCAQLRSATSTELAGCIDGGIVAVDMPDRVAPPGAPAANEHEGIDEALAAVGLPAVSGRVDLVIPFVDGYFTPAVIVPPDLAPTTATRFYVPIPASDYSPQASAAHLAALAPTAMLNPLVTSVDRLDTPRIYRGLIAIGTTSALAVGLAALLVAVTSAAIERRRPMAHLAAVGTPAATIRRTVVLQIAPVSFVLLILAATASILGGDAYIRWGYPNEALPLAALAKLLLAGVAITIIAAVSAAVTATHPSRAEVLRQE